MCTYLCESCESVFTVLAKEDSESVSCPKCESVSRKHSAFETEFSASTEASTKVYGFG